MIPFLDLLGPDLSHWVAQFIVTVARLSFVIALIPGIGEQMIPAQVRVYLLLGLAAAISGLGITDYVLPDNLTDFGIVIVTELLLSLFLGIGLRVVIWTLNIAGSVIAQSIGLAQPLGVALENESQTATANLLSMAGAALLFSMNFHVQVISSWIELYDTIPIGGSSWIAQAFLFDSIYAAFAFAILLAWPFVAMNLLYNVCLGFINKAMPQMMVAFVGAPFLVGAGMFLLAVSIAAMLMVWQDQIAQLIVWL
ncbi:MAG: flagellar biosynthetic protein FliR [Hyphomonadaceae bacterium]|nr:flagellar biosynthetic protein FliR [Hyphomonadaceae bacterium]